MSDNGGPAFPDTYINCPEPGEPEVRHMWNGLSKRDYFAAKALQGCLSYSHVSPLSGNWQENCSIDGLAAHCYLVADAMLKARERINAS